MIEERAEARIFAETGVANPDAAVVSGLTAIETKIAEGVPGRVKEWIRECIPV